MTARTVVSDTSFWVRQNSVSPKLDHPHMESTARRPSHPEFELFITSPAGKPLYYFAYDSTNPDHPRYNDKAAPRPPASIASLAATLTAFQEATFNRVSVITTESTTCLTYIHNSLHVVLVSQQRPAPILFLQAIVRLSIVTTNFILSASLGDYLRSRPNARPSFASAEPLLNASLLDAISHPLSYSLLKPVALSSSTIPSSQKQLSHLVSNIVRSHKDVSHTVMFTAGPPFPPRIVLSCSPADKELTSLDLLLLSVCQSPQSSDLTVREPMKIYPQCLDFRKSVYATSRLLQLRLHCDYYETFKRAVGGGQWRPEWTQQSPHTIQLLALSSSVENASSFLDNVEEALDRAPAVTNLLISMERPLSVQPFRIHGVRDIIVLKDEKRVAGSLGSFCYTAAISTIITIQHSKIATEASTSIPSSIGRGRDSIVRDKRAVLTNFSKWGLRVVLWDSRFVILFDLDESKSEDECIRACRDIFVPQLERFAGYIVPTDDRVTIYSNTLLAGFLAPFLS